MRKTLGNVEHNTQHSDMKELKSRISLGGQKPQSSGAKKSQLEKYFK